VVSMHRSAQVKIAATMQSSMDYLYLFIAKVQFLVVETGNYA